MRAAVIGTHWGTVHVAALRAAGAQVVAIVDRVAERGRVVAADLGVPEAISDVGALASLGLDLISVATPAATHVEVIAALPPDVPVLCEKPAIGLSQVSLLPARSAPVWVNYAFAFLAVAERAADALTDLGPVRSARVRSTHDLGRIRLTPEEMFFELVPHPWSWLITLLGAPGAAPTRPRQRQTGSVDLRCGDVPTALHCAPEAGLDGLRHTVVVEADGGRVVVRGTYREGDPWVFDAPRCELPSGEVRILGDPEAGPSDPWYRANERAIGAVVHAVRTGQGDARLFDWSTAVAMDEVVRAGLAGRGEP